MRYLRLFCWVVFCAWAGACDAAPDALRGGRDGEGEGDGKTPPGCGNGTLTDDEACDDGNTEDGDGCQGDCLAVEEGYSCNPPGMPCRLMSKCGNGSLTTPEFCDDGNQDRGDGCNDLCMVEVGFKCEGEPSVCTPTVCGDNVIEGAEACEDGNAMPFDGCDADCQVEPRCENGGNCRSTCGDGLVIGEECDDGNNMDGDGCSADCEEEPGYDCSEPGTEGFMVVPVIYKDFNSSHPDFEPGALDCTSPTLGMVETTLNANGKPVAALTATDGCGTSTRLSEWYDHGGNSDAIVFSRLTLWDNGNGGFVNQWGENGEQWQATGQEWCGSTADNAAPCDFEYDDWCDDNQDIMIDCVSRDGTDWGVYLEATYDGDPFFFPMDGLGITPRSAYTGGSQIGPTYGYDSWPTEVEAIAQAGLTPPDGYSYSHNFHFTSEVRFWFQYDDTSQQVLSFVGDDDVWVFINNELVVDLGGIHTPQEGNVRVNDLGLTHGEVYEIVVFQAERQTNGSTYRLTLSGFSTSRSECRPKCGDEVIGIGEQCDDGVNDGGYGECDEGCVLGEYCGDGILQEEYEDCDDGNFINNDDCPTSCRFIIVV